MLLLIDNFDSFTYNLVQAFQTLQVETQVVRAETVDIENCLKMQPQHIVIGPGPGHPSQATFSKKLMLTCDTAIPILGVCLGHQALAELYDGQVGRAAFPMHGKTSLIQHTNRGIFHGLPQDFVVTRYHSLIVDEKSLPACLEVTAVTVTPVQEIMGIKHRDLPREGVQFHPESVLSEYGLDLLRNFLAQ